MYLIIGIFPGFALACAILFAILGVINGYVFSQTNYRRSNYIMWFCFLSAFYSLYQFVGQSRQFDPIFTLNFGRLAQMSLMASFMYYLKAMRFYVVISDRFAKGVYVVILFLLSCFVLPIPYELWTGTHFYFDVGNVQDSGSWFANSYTMRIGVPYSSINIMMTIFGLVSAATATYLFKVVISGSRDRFLLAGLFVSLLASLYQFLLLPITLEYFVPIIFVTNMFEAFRMSFLSAKEFILESEEGRGATQFDDSEKYQNINFNKEKIEKMASEVESLMKRPEVFTNPSLRLEDLSRRLRVPSYLITQVINLGLGQNFSDLVNKARVEYVKELMLDPEYGSETIMNLAYKAGFNSKSTFNVAFKKFEGMTPSAYRRQKSSVS